MSISNTFGFARFVVVGAARGLPPPFQFLLHRRHEPGPLVCLPLGIGLLGCFLGFAPFCCRWGRSHCGGGTDTQGQQ